MIYDKKLKATFTTFHKQINVLDMNLNLTLQKELSTDLISELNQSFYFDLNLDINVRIII